ncbi:sugar-binding transcriptional regulator [uncultured Clostridium sp.]|uniref:sugar-binding transcriptional regulator n=1 Tax=uncultured Clostridium sp. TaxID=59620 RepID=UPI0025CBDEA5|nr:sugar-binding domain-containing protein [uncultured Clostridium sp.]
MKNILEFQQKIVPELMELLKKRYDILRTIYYNQPIGRRVLANSLGMGERIVRTEIRFLRNQGFIKINTSGMTVTREGEKIVDGLKNFIHELKGLSEIEKYIKDNLKLRDIVIVPGDCDKDETVKNDIGRNAANYFKNIAEDDDIIALTGGSTVKSVIDSISEAPNFKNILVVPARGGIGRNMETQANTLAARLANKVGGTYKLLHVPDNLSEEAIKTIVKEKDVKDIVKNIYSADVLIYGIGRACKMAQRREMPQDKIDEIQSEGAVGEAFGYYFDKQGKIIYSTPSIGIKNERIGKIKTLIAVAGGSSKGEAILSVERNNHNSILITDEGAARQIMKFIK